MSEKGEVVGGVKGGEVEVWVKGEGVGVVWREDWIGGVGGERY